MILRELFFKLLQMSQLRRREEFHDVAGRGLSSGGGAGFVSTLLSFNYKELAITRCPVYVIDLYWVESPWGLTCDFAGFLT